MARSLHSIAAPLPLSYSSSKAYNHHALTLSPLSAPASSNAVRAASAPHRASAPAHPSRRRGSFACMAQPEIMTSGVVTDTNFKELVLESSLPVLVDFWAPWCGPCRMIAPLIDDIAKEYAGRLVCLKLNTDESPNVATELGIRSIPTVMFFQAGKKVDTVIGAVPKTTLTNIIDKYVSE